jgi:hypothetical protein
LLAPGDTQPDQAPAAAAAAAAAGGGGEGSADLDAAAAKSLQLVGLVRDIVERQEGVSEGVFHKLVADLLLSVRRWAAGVEG